MTSIQTVAVTDTGRGRPRNEDAVHVDPELGLAVVADGMGGHPAGDRASALAVREVAERLGSSGPPPAEAGDEVEEPSPDPEYGGPGRDVDMAETVRAANRRILQDGREHPERRGMGTTLTVLRVDPASRRFEIGHVGDSRAYRFREGSLEPLTRDHTPLQEMVDAGELSREQARLHPMSHMLAQALGTASEVDPQVIDGEARPGDHFILCTDGLNAVLSDARIEEALREGKPADLDGAARRLVDRTLEGGAPDNVTVALLRISDEDAGEAVG